MTECEFRICENGEYLCKNKMMGQLMEYSCENCIDGDVE